MAIFMIDDDVALKVDEFAKREDISREDFVNRAIELYLQEKLTDELDEHGRRLGVKEAIKRGREERGCAEQIEHWVKIGKIAEENPDLPYNFIEGVLDGFTEMERGEISPFEFRN